MAVSLTASKTDDVRFAEIEEMASALLRFPGERLAQFTCSFGSASASELEVVGTKGSLRISRAFDYKGELRWLQNIGGKSKEKRFAPRDQFAPELLYFSDCILKDKAAEPDGFAGWADVRVVNAIYKAAKTRRAVRIEPVHPQQCPSPQQQKIKRRPVKEPRLTKVQVPEQEE